MVFYVINFFHTDIRIICFTIAVKLTGMTLDHFLIVLIIMIYKTNSAHAQNPALEVQIFFKIRMFIRADMVR